MTKEVNPHAWDKILDRFENPEEMREVLMARQRGDAYPREFVEVMMGICYNEFGGDCGKTATFCAVPYQTVKNMWRQDQKKARERATKEAPLDEFVEKHVSDNVPALKEALAFAIQILPEKMKRMTVADTLKYVPQIAKLIRQLETGELLGEPPAPKKVTTPQVVPPSEAGDADVSAILAKAEERLGGEAAN